MDPLSVSTSIVTLVNAGSQTAKALKYTYKTYHDAPQEISEIAAEIDLINGLFDNVAVSIERSPETYSEGFLKRATNMINNVCFSCPIRTILLAL